MKSVQPLHFSLGLHGTDTNRRGHRPPDIKHRHVRLQPRDCSEHRTQKHVLLSVLKLSSSSQRPNKVPVNSYNFLTEEEEKEKLLLLSQFKKLCTITRQPPVLCFDPLLYDTYTHTQRKSSSKAPTSSPVGVQLSISNHERG